jgi:hypothetical protein
LNAPIIVAEKKDQEEREDDLILFTRRQKIKELPFIS